MSSQLGYVIFIIWRESVEALLVVGMLIAWLHRQDNPQARRTGHLWLWAGVGAGLLAIGYVAPVPPGDRELKGD